MNECQPFYDLFFYTILNDIDVDAIEKECYDLRKQSEGRHLSNINGWQSNNLDKSNMPSAIGDLQIKIDIFANQVKDEIALREVKNSNLWVNINPPNSYNRMHTHPFCVLSGVFYVKAPKNCGNLVFSRDRSFSDYFCQTFDETNPNYRLFEDWWVPPEEGKLVIFPSYLQHHVDINESKSDRISISFNYGLND